MHFAPLIKHLFALAIAVVAVAFATASYAVATDTCCLVLPPDGADVDTTVFSTWGVPIGTGVSPQFSKFLVHIDAVPTPPIPAGTYAAWCFDATTLIEIAPTGTLFGGKLYSSCDPTIAFNTYLPPHPGVIHSASDWKKINYLINHRSVAPDGSTPTMWEVQVTILLLFGQTPPSGSPYPTYRGTVVQSLMDAADANASRWTPGPTDKVAVILNIDVNWDAFTPVTQLIFFEVPCPRSTILRPLVDEGVHRSRSPAANAI